jgi:hypothetical protein
VRDEAGVRIATRPKALESRAMAVELEELARRRAAEKGGELVIQENPWEASIEQDSALGRVVLQSGGESPTREAALQRLLAIDDIGAQADEHSR